ncbi:MAG: DUF6054 family protein [Oscillospiraceae bacterium]
MAKYECNLQGDCKELMDLIIEGILNGSSSASLEGGSDFDTDEVHCSVRVFERYSMIGGNRVSLNVAVFENRGQLSLSAITSGGSQAVLFKVNTFGEEAFLECLEEIVKDYKTGR